MVFYDQRPFGQGEDLILGDREPLPVRFRNGDLFRRFPLGVGVNHFYLFSSELLLDDRPEICAQGRLEDVELVGIDGSLNDHLAQPVRRRDENCVAKTGFGINGENNSGGRQIGPYHFLNADRERNRHMVEPLVDPVGDGPVGEKGGKTTLARVDQLFFSPDVQKSLLLSGKAGVGKVLGGSRTPHGHVGFFPVLIAQLPVGRDNFFPEILRQLGVVDKRPDLFPPLAQVFDVVRIEIRQKLVDFIRNACRLEKITISMGRYGITIGNVDALRRKLADHLAQRCILAPDLWNVLQLQLIKPDHEFVVHMSS